MEILILIFIIAAVITIIKLQSDTPKKNSKKREEKTTHIYKKKKFLLNIPERKFFENIQQFLPQNYSIFPQILLSTIITPEVENRKEFITSQNKINRKTIDFVIFSIPYLTPILAIEYDGKTHQRPDRVQRDTFVNTALQNASIPILHIPHTSNLDYTRIHTDIQTVLKTNEK